MSLYKFLAPGAMGPYSGFTWPTGAGEEAARWVEAAGALVPCANGVHAIRASVLPDWLAEELWTVEVEGEAEEEDGVVLARRGRLLARVAAWDGETAGDYARACAARARLHAEAAGTETAAGYLADAERHASNTGTKEAASAALTAARAAEEAAPGGFAAERAWQAGWLVERLALEA